MRFIDHFNGFLANEVNLSQARLDQLDERVGAIDSFLNSGDDEISTRFVQTIPQGSYAHRTIINPVDDNDEFDADVLLELTEEPDWSASDYIEELYKVFRSSSRYRSMVSRHARCVKVDYANEFHIDVVPYVERHGEHYICNRDEGDDGEFELTNPEGFNEWLDQQDQTTGGKLIKVVRLLKYLRDYKNTFSLKSVILNILVGGRVNSALLLGDPDHYKDLPTAFKNLLADLNDYLQANPMMPNLTDPSCPSENFNHRCDQDQYTNLRKWIKYYSDKATAAFKEIDPETSLKLWREIFGDDFGVPSTAVTKATAAHVGRARNTEQLIERDLHIPLRIDPRYRVTLDARVQPKAGFRTYDLQKHGNAVGKYRTIRFSLGKCNVPGPYEVYWKVRNTGEEAIRADCIRGQIVKDTGSLRRDEPTKYRGKHYVECYIVRNGVCVARAHQSVVIK
jgi:Second Messenger Oligonucleotide or Dinucleotide Synthetase domain/Adenylyl/Guanylyl and SMODS C-terminal sensor domain